MSGWGTHPGRAAGPSQLDAAVPWTRGRQPRFVAELQPGARHGARIAGATGASRPRSAAPSAGLGEHEGEQNSRSVPEPENPAPCFLLVSRFRSLRTLKFATDVEATPRASL